MFGQNKTPMAMGFFGQPLAEDRPLRGRDRAGSQEPRRSAARRAWSGAGSSFSNGGVRSGGAVPSRVAARLRMEARPSGRAGALRRQARVRRPGKLGDGPAAAEPALRIRARSLSSNQTFGGGGIIGFSPASPKQSILIYKKKNHYNEWEFLYSPLARPDDAGRREHRNHWPTGGRHSATAASGRDGNVERCIAATGNGSFSNPPGGRPPTAPTVAAAMKRIGTSIRMRQNKSPSRCGWAFATEIALRLTR